jgi:cobalamin biosynthesis Mg chelatase CobN
MQYTVNLASGSTWGTSISVSNAGSLAGQGTSISFSNPSADPPFSGTATITTSPTTPAGSYQIQLVATGDDPSSSTTTFTLTVNGKTTTIASTTIPVGSGANTTGTNSTGKNNTGTNSTGRNSSTTAPAYTTSVAYNTGGSQPNYGSSSTALDVSILAVIVLFLVIILALKFA